MDNEYPFSIKLTKNHLRLYRKAIILAALVLFLAAYHRDKTGIPLEWLAAIGVCLALLWFWVNSAIGGKRRKETLVEDEKK